jgi:ABC-type branched-subunit amino acid transport system substrate-binding protein
MLQPRKSIPPIADSPDIEWIREIYARHFPKKQLQSLTMLGMGMATIVIEGLKRAGPELTREGFIDALHTLKEFDTKILASPVTFTPDDHNSATKVIIKTLVEGKEVYLKEPKWPGIKKY